MKIFRIVAVSILLAMGIAACEKQGPFESAGEEIDNAVDDSKDALEDACEEAKEAVGAEDKDC